MRTSFVLLVAACSLLLGVATARATVAYADSDVFFLDAITGVDDPADRLPAMTRLASIQPNPFNPSTTIAFELAADGPLELAIFDLRGRLVTVLVSGSGTAGRHRADWNGLDRQGRIVPSGAYICRLVCGGQAQTMKLLLAR